MKKILKQALGIDVAKDELVVSLGHLHDDLTIQVIGRKTFQNNKKGFVSLVSWVSKQIGTVLPCRYVMEATGVYHEPLAYYLDQEGYEVSIVLPNKISNYFRTLETKTINDKSSSEAIVQFGLERKLDRWYRPKSIFKKLRQLTRERDQIVQERTIAKNQLHAELSEAEPHSSSVRRMRKRIVFLTKQEREIKQEIATMVAQDKQVCDSIKGICSIPGVGVLTAATILAETNGFDLIRNKKQLTSYAGLDVREKESGTSVRGKTRISKRGNRYLRKAMHLPALAAIRSSENMKGIFARLVSRHGIKMKAAVAVQRKLLELIYILYKTKNLYDKNYQLKTEKQPSLM